MKISAITSSPYKNNHAKIKTLKNRNYQNFMQNNGVYFTSKINKKQVVAPLSALIIAISSIQNPFQTQAKTQNENIIKTFDSDNISSATVISTNNPEIKNINTLNEDDVIYSDTKKGYNVEQLIDDNYGDLSADDKNILAKTLLTNDKWIKERVRDNFQTDENIELSLINSEDILDTDISYDYSRLITAPEINVLKNIGSQGENFMQGLNFPSEWYFANIKFTDSKEYDKEKLRTDIKNQIAKQYSNVNGKELPKDEQGNYILDSYAGENILRAIFLDERNNHIFINKTVNNTQDIIDAIIYELNSYRARGDKPVVKIYTPDVSLSFIYKSNLKNPFNYAVAKRNVLTSYLGVSQGEVSYLQLQEIAQKEGRKQVLAKDLLNFVNYQNQTLKETLDNAQGTSKQEAIEALCASAVVQIAQSNPEILNNLFLNTSFTKEELLNSVIAPIKVIDDVQSDDMQYREISDFNIKLENIAFMN